jgi:hypothetical protein
MDFDLLVLAHLLDPYFEEEVHLDLSSFRVVLDPSGLDLGNLLVLFCHLDHLVEESLRIG